MSTLESRVIKKIAETLRMEANDIKPATRFVEDMKLDSMDTVELVLAMEEEFSTDGENIEISDDDAQSFASVGDVIKYLEGRGLS